jgi:hypothetical protein
MEWKKIKAPDGAKLFKVHNFTYMIKGSTYHFEIDEFLDGTITGHGEHSTDKSHVLESVSATSVKDCLENLIKSVKTR